MADQDLYSGLIRLHVLHHAAEERIFGLGMIRELLRHGYRIGPGTLYPLLHRLEEKGYLTSSTHIIDGKARRSYAITDAGRRALAQARQKVRELFNEMYEHQENLKPNGRSPTVSKVDTMKLRRAARNGK